MVSRKQGPLDGTLAEAVARAAKRPVEDVAGFLARHDIRAQTLIPRPVNVTIRAVRLRGVKTIRGESSPYEFDWNSLGPGLWLIGSEGNSKGKTSLFAVMRWLLRGTPPDSLTDTVKGWINHAELDFDVGRVPHRTTLDVAGGYVVRVVQEPGPGETPVIETETPDGFASAMSDYMMTQLQLERVTTLRMQRGADPQGLVVQHAWPSLFGAFHIGTDYSSLLGSTSMEGLPTRMLNMFAGFPHASAVARTQFVLSGLKVDAQREDKSQRAVAIHARNRLVRLEADLAALGRPDDSEEAAAATLATIRELTARLGSLYGEFSAARRIEAEAGSAAVEARDLLNADRLALRMFLEARAAAVVFRALTPSCCPRCDQRLAGERMAREKSELACMVCGEAAPSDERGDPAVERETLEAAVTSSQKLDEAARDAKTAASAKVARFEAEVREFERKLATLETKRAAASASAATRERRAILEALIGEARQDAELDEGPAFSTDDTVLAEACDRVLRERLKAEQEEILQDVMAEMLLLLRSFGVADLDEVELKSNVHLNLSKGGVTTNYGRLSPGEKLRTKIALVLALMKVAHRRGIGRHPSLLFIDTPGAQETIDKDLRALSGGLASLRDEMPQLQIFVATTRVAEFEEAVPSQYRRVATGTDGLW